MKKIITSKKIFNLLMAKRKKYEDEYFSGRILVQVENGRVVDHYLPQPEQYFVLGDKNQVKELIKISTEKGCGGNNEISGQQLATIILTADAKNLSILGLARVGMFDKNNRINVAYDYQRLLASNNWFEMIFGRNGYEVVRFGIIKNSWHFDENKLQLVVK